MAIATEQRPAGSPSRRLRAGIDAAGPGPHAPDAAQAASQFVVLVHELLEEAHPGRHRVIEATLDSSLDKDLGLDSLARVELLN
jgi:hypothetical protein